MWFFKGLNLSILSTSTDFFVVSLVKLNQKCTADLRNQGPAPMTGNGIYTLVRQNNFFFIYNTNQNMMCNFLRKD